MRGQVAHKDGAVLRHWDSGSDFCRPLDKFSGDIHSPQVMNPREMSQQPPMVRQC